MTFWGSRNIKDMAKGCFSRACWTGIWEGRINGFGLISGRLAIMFFFSLLWISSGENRDW